MLIYFYFDSIKLTKSFNYFYNFYNPNLHLSTYSFKGFMPISIYEY